MTRNKEQGTSEKIIGHSRAVAILKRLADAGELAHGHLFFGSAGIGKRFLAESLAHYCEGGEFRPANRVLNDFLLLRPDEEGKIGIEAARQVKLFLYSRPNVSNYRLVLIDEAHRLTPEAQNALLKIAEEPPSSGVLILITSDPEGLFPTLRSRLHQMYFGAVRVPPKSCTEKETKERAAAAQFLKIPSSARKELVKNIIAPLDFNLVRFLDVCISLLAEEFEKGNGNRALWHKLLALRAEAARGSLNPRLQLLALFADH